MSGMKRFFENFMKSGKNPGGAKRFSLPGRRKASSLSNSAHSTRHLGCELLEERQLLSVTANEFAGICTTYADFDLSENMEDYNIMEIQAGDVDSLRRAAETAALTQADDLIVIRAGAESDFIDLGSESLSFNLYDSSGVLTVVGLGDNLARIIGSSENLITVNSGTVQLAGLSLLGDALDNSQSIDTLIMTSENASVQTSRLLYAVENSTDNYAVSFKINGKETVYLNNADKDSILFYGEAIAVTVGSDSGLESDSAEYKVNVFMDAEKIGTVDTLLCWAGTASNMLAYTEWANTYNILDASSTLAVEDQVFSYYRDHFTDKGGNSRYAVDWFLTGNYAPAGWADWSQITTPGGAFYQSVSISDALSTISGSSGCMKSVASSLKSNCGVGISLGWYNNGVRSGGHAITVWGYTYDTTKTVGADDYYTGIIVSDSDDNIIGNINAPNRLKTLALTWNSTSQSYNLSDYSSGSGWIENFYALKNISAVNVLTNITLSKTNPYVGDTITTTLTPASGKADYQWYRGTSANNITEMITDATASSYTVTAEDLGYFLKVVATGKDDFSGTVYAVTNAAVMGKLTKAQFTETTSIVGTDLTINLTPEGATADFQWYRGKSKNGSFDPIYGATGQTYTVTEADLGYYIKGIATGSGFYSEQVTVTTNTYVTQPITSIIIQNTEIKVGVAITTKQDPSLSSSTYQWYYGTGSGNITTLIEGANESHYIPTADQHNGYFRVVATGTGFYTGTVEASTVSVGKSIWELTKVTLSETAPDSEATITATLTPNGADVDWKWYRGTSKDNINELIESATGSAYTVTSDDYGCYLKVVVTGKENYTGTVSASTSVAIVKNVSNLTLNNTAPNVGTILGADLEEAGDQVTYQWYRGADPDNISMMIYGATAQNYTVTEADRGYYLKVVATGINGYSGAVSASSEKAVPVIMIDAKLVMTLAPNETTDAEIALPQSITNALKGQTVYAEVWVKNATVSDKGINGGYVDISFDSTKITASEEELHHGTIYNSLPTGTIDNTIGLIDDFGGAYFSSGGVNTNGITKWVRLGYAAFVTQEAGEVTLKLKEGDIEFASGLDNISWESVRFTDASFTVEATCNYDLDNSGVIDLADFHVFSAAYGSVIGDANWNVHCDFDKDGKITQSDFQWFQNAYGKNTGDLNVNTDFPQAGSTAPTTDWKPAAGTDTPIELVNNITDSDLQISVIWRTALSENESAADLPNQTEFILRGEKVYAEIWVKNTRTASEGISGGYLDFNFSAANLQASIDANSHGDLYKTLTAGTVDNTAGTIDNFGGAYLSENGVNTNGIASWVRLGYLAFDSVAAGKTALTLESGTLPFANQANIDWTKINFSSPELDVREACIYDLDNSGVVDLNDYTIFIKAYGSTGTSENWNIACDFDKNGSVNEIDYNYFNAAFGKEAYDPTLVYPEITVTPTPAPVEGEIITEFSAESVALAADPVMSITVVNTNDSGAGSLRQAISDIANGGTITFASNLASKTIRLGTTLNVSKSVTIDASSLSSNIIISGNDKCRVMKIDSNKDIIVKLNNLTITKGYAEGSGEDGGGIYFYNGSKLNLDHCNIIENKSDRYGGGLAIRNAPKIFEANYCIFSNNTSYSDGGGIYYYRAYVGDVIITNSEVTNNNSKNGLGGGLYFECRNTNLENVNISNNTSYDNGGGCYLQGDATVKGCTVDSNKSSSGDGGGLYLYTGGDKTIRDCKITNNVSAKSGGGLYCFIPNSMDSAKKYIYIVNSLIANNKSVISGAGVCFTFYLDNNDVTFTNCTITQNRISTDNYDGAGLYFDTYHGNKINFHNSIICENYLSDTKTVNDIASKSNRTPEINGISSLSGFTEWTTETNCIEYKESPFAGSSSRNYLLKKGSAAINAGDNTKAAAAGLDDSSKDLGGNDRFNGIIDIGCYEYQGEPVDLISITLSTTTPEIDTVITTTLDPEVNPQYITYQWFRGTSKNNITNVIAGATSSSYSVTARDKGTFLKVVATGKGKYNGEVSASTTDIVHGPLNEITILEENPSVGTTITTELDPAGAYATYQWYRGTDASNVNSMITGATSSRYIAQAADYGYYLKVVAKGAHGFTGTVSATTFVKVNRQMAISTDRPEVGMLITSNIVPADEGATYQWYRGYDPTNINIAIDGATVSSYTVTQADLGYYLKLVVKTTKDETLSDGTAYKVSQKMESITLSTAFPKVNTTITTSLLPAGTTAAYQWYRGIDPNNVTARISGATSDSYTVTAADYGYYLKVVATGTGNYSGTVSAVSASKVELPSVDVSLVLSSKLSDSDTSAALAESTQYIQTGKNFYVEIWVKNLDPADPGILGGYVDLTFNKDNLSVVSVQNSAIYGSLAKGEADNAIGLVDNLGGATALDDDNNYGQSGWVRLGIVEFKALQAGKMDLSLQQGQWQFAAVETGNLDWSEIRFNDLKFTVEGLKEPANPSVLPKCIYDLNDNGTIEMNDFNIFQEFFGLSTDSTAYEEKQNVIFEQIGITVDCDFDNSGKVDLRDFSYFIAAFGKDADDPTVIYSEAASSSQSAEINTAVEFDSALASPLAQALAAQLPLATPEVYDAEVYDAEVHSILVSEKSTVDTAEELPKSESIVVLNDNVYLELWAKTTDPTAKGISGAFFDIEYDPEKVNADSLSQSSIYTAAESAGGKIKTDSEQNEVGLVQNFGGYIIKSGVYGVQEWVKIGTVTFKAASEGECCWEVSGGKTGFGIYGNYCTTWDDIQITSASAYIAVRPDASLSETDFCLQYGGSIYIDSQLPADSKLKTLWDLSGTGTGEFVETEHSFRFNPAKQGLKAGNYVLRYKTVNEFGLESDIVSVDLTVCDTLPTVKIEKTSYLNDQLVRLNLEVISTGSEKFNNWIINWGDEQPTEVSNTTFSLSALHYYQNYQPDRPFNISLRLIGDNGTTLNYFLMQHTIETPLSAPAIAANEFAPELLESEQTLALSPGIGNPLLESTAPQLEISPKLSKIEIPINYATKLAPRILPEENFLNVLENDDFDQTLDLLVKENAVKYNSPDNDSDTLNDDLLAIW